MRQNTRQTLFIKTWRIKLLTGLFISIAIVLCWRVYDLQIKHNDFLKSQADARQQRVVDITANRGAIVDRYGHLLALSTPVDSIWVNPRLLQQEFEVINTLADFLQIDAKRLQRHITNNSNKSFLYIKRHVEPAFAQALLNKKLKGVFSQREYKRYYPLGEVTSHLLGFTNIDDQGQEGLELAYDHWLSGEPGSKRILQDRLGRTIEDLEYIKKARPGRELALSIDKRIQYVAYRELKKAVIEHQAVSGSVVIIDVSNGEVLAIVNQPTFNPNNRKNLRPEFIRNRAVIDVFEPGSTIKAFTVAAALQSGQYQLESTVNTSPGILSIDGFTIRDVINYGLLDLSGIIKKSSNVGASKLALSIPEDSLWSLLRNLGFGRATDVGYPGEQSGILTHYDRWSNAERAALSYGYGISTTVLQLTHAYSALANGGRLYPLSLQKQTTVQQAVQVIDAKIAAQVKNMLKTVVADGGTGQGASVPGYQVAGKTGTVKVSHSGGYAEDRYLSLFAGLVPVSNPKLAAVILINEPRGGEYYGGKVAAPVFAKIMSDTLRLLDVMPDNLASTATVEFGS